MKRARILGLVLVALVATVSLLNVGAASSTALCEKEAEGEWCKSAFPAKTAYAASTKSVTFETNLGSLTCSKSAIEGETSEEATEKGVNLKSTVSSLTFSGCTLAEKACTLTAVNAPYSAPIAWTEGQKGTFALKKGEAGTPGVTMKCGTMVNCTVSGEPVLDLNGGSKEKATLVASKDKLTPGEGTCFKEISWTSTYTFSAPNGGELFVAQQARVVKLCKKQESPCVAAETYGNGTPLEAVLASSPPKAIFRYTILDEETSELVPRNFSCERSTIKGETRPPMGRTLPIKITEIKFEECGAVCTPTVLALPYDLGQIEGSNVGTGNWSMWGSTQEPEIKLNCNPLYVCFYKTAFFGGTNKMNIFGGAPAKLEVKQLIETLTGASSAICGEKLEWEGDYKFTKPENGMPKMWPME